MFLPLELTLRSSRIYALIMVVVHVLVLLGIWLAALSVLVKVLMTGSSWPT